MKLLNIKEKNLIVHFIATSLSVVYLVKEKILHIDLFHFQKTPGKSDCAFMLLFALGLLPVHG
jgi:hypothetical protein